MLSHHTYQKSHNFALISSYDIHIISFTYLLFNIFHGVKSFRSKSEKWIGKLEISFCFTNLFLVIAFNIFVLTKSQLVFMYYKNDASLVDKEK